MNKIIIHNLTDKDDLDMLQYIVAVIAMGKISNCKYGEKYCHFTTFKDGHQVGCDRRNDTYTFKLVKER